MYPQVFGRNPDSGGLTYWTNRLASKKITRQGLMVQFTQSSEMKSKFSTRVAAALGISQQSYSRKINAFTSANIKCYGTVVTDAAGKWCQINANQTGSAVFSAQVTDGIIKDDASYVICYDVATTGVDNTTHQFALFAKQLQNSVNDATLVENINGGGGVVPLNGKSCLNYTDTKDKIKSFLAYVISKDQTANSLVKVNLDTLYLGQVLNQDSGFLQKQPNAQTTQGAGGPIKLGTQTKNTAYTVHSVQSDSTKTQPYLAHTTEFFSGKKSVLGLECEPGYGKQATVRATVTNVDTGEKLTNSELEFVEYDSSDNQYIRRFKPEQNITLPSSLSYYAAPDISFKTESTKPIRAKVALTIVNGNCSATNSSRGYNFWWSYQN
jgi:hypothetical protein